MGELDDDDPIPPVTAANVHPLMPNEVDKPYLQHNHYVYVTLKLDLKYM